MDSEDTRTNLLNTAILLFGRHGYDGVTTRRLAEAADANVASIKYHFGNKDALYRGAIDHVVETLQPRLEMLLDLVGQARQIARNDPERQALLVSQLVEVALNTFLRTPEMRPIVPFMLRELFVPGPHFDRLYQPLSRRLHESLTELVAWILQLDPRAPATIVRAQALIGQLVVYQIGRAILQRRLGVEDYGEAEIELIRAQATHSVLMSLGLPSD
jgi:AcrR family transcriptional regulator